MNDLVPLVIESPTPYAGLPASHPPTAGIVAEVLDAVGCKIQSCPFVFVIAVAGPPGISKDIGGIAFNYGFNGGGGFVRMPVGAAETSHAPSSKFQSTLLHELGHAFGLAHTADVYTGPGVTHLPPPSCQEPPRGPASGAGPGPDPYDDVSDCPLGAYQLYCSPTFMTAARARIEFHCSPSVMSYSKLNWTSGCPILASPGHCAMPDAATIAALPGALIAENVHNLAHNELVFPALATDFDLHVDDDDGDLQVQWHLGNGAPDVPYLDIPGHPRMTAWSSDSDFGTPPRVAFGYHSRTIPRASAWFHVWRMWHSTQVGDGGWAEVTFDFPEGVELGRLRVFTGYQDGLHGAAGGQHPATAIEVQRGPLIGVVPQPLTTCGSVLLRGKVDGDVWLDPTCTGPVRRYRVRVRAGASGYVVVRGVRFFDTSGAELQGPREPVPATSDGHPGVWATPASNVIGGEQQIASYTTFFDAERMWHSKDVGANGWVTIDLRLPALTTLSSIATYTGHGGAYNPANRVRVAVRGATGDYTEIANVPAAPSQSVALGYPQLVTHLRLGFRAGPSGHVVVRGIRLFTPWGEEFAPRSVQDPLVPLL